MMTRFRFRRRRRRESLQDYFISLYGVEAKVKTKIAQIRITCYTLISINAYGDHMPDDSTTRWTVSVSKDTDISVRSFLAQRGMKKGDLSKFIEDAVRWRVLDQTMAEARTKFSDLQPEALDSLIQEAVTSAREASGKNAG
jgi:hypothetical protein